MAARWSSLVLVPWWLAACGSEDAPEPAPSPCNNGMCCVTPDDGLCDAIGGCAPICVRTYDDDAAAVPAIADYEARTAAEEGRAPRAFVAATDPRFARTRAVLDRAWDAFRDTRAVGPLYDRHLALVVIDDPKPNAFAWALFGFTVVAHSGVVETASTEDGLVAVMAHELQHLLGQGASAAERLRNFYVAPDGDEPIGRNQAQDAAARDYAVRWRTASQDAGPFALEELGGMPSGGQLARLFTRALGRGDPARCANAIALRERFDADVAAATDRVSGALQLERAPLPARVTQILDAARGECLAGVAADAIDVMADLAHATRDQIAASLTERDRTMVAGRPAIDGIADLVRDRRAAMRAAEGEAAAALGRPWSALRFFSMEEDADDVSVAVLRAAGLPPDALRSFLLAVLPETARTACTDALEARAVPPYGIDLRDDHHGTCWRAYHVRALAETTLPVRRALPVREPPTAPDPPALPIPDPLGDRLHD